jgi:uncharacterized protein (TIGR02099 family)
LTDYRIFSKLRQNVAIADRLRWLGVSSLWVYRVLTWSVLVAGLAFAAAVIALRYWILPGIGSYREDIVRIVSERVGQKVDIGRIDADWDGLRPQLRLENVTVHDAAGRPAFTLARMDQTVSWRSLATLELRFHALNIHGPTLTIRRDPRGVVSIAGIALEGAAQDSGFADWLLRQRDIEVTNATVVWNDELRGAPLLELRDVSLQMYSRGSRHRFGLRATPPPGLASPLDIRGDVRGTSIASLAQWSGRLYLRIEYADIAAWRAWAPFPFDFPQGAGALRAWLSFSGDRLLDAVADVGLAGVRARLAADLPELDLSELSGRVSWKQVGAGYEFATSRLGLTTTGGLTLHPADFLLRVVAGGERRQGRGEIHANSLELAPLTALADHLPLSPEVRKRLAAYSPGGSLHDVTARWTGDWFEPQQFSVRGRFQGLSLNRTGRVPGFSGISGTLEANERGGTLSVNSHKARVDMPLVFRDALQFDALAAQASWTRTGRGTELRLNSVSFSNSHLAGTVFGNYRTAGDTRGEIDLTGQLTRADARYVARYVPNVVGRSAREWMDRAFLAGQSNDVTLRLKGNLDRFPFADGKSGIFQVTARVAGGVLRYANGWPDIEDIAGDVVFRGKRMDVNARQGRIMGVRLGKVHVEIPDLLVHEEVVNVKGEAEGPTGEFLGFIARSPVSGMIDRFTEDWQAQGTGRLALRLSIPLQSPDRTKVSGSYQFAGNHLVLSRELPAVEQASGRAEFTESSVRVENASAVVLGGPVRIAATTGRDSTVRVTLQGRINTESVARAGAPSWVRHLRGATDWRAVVNARRNDADVVIESSLQGLAVGLPAPLAKTASEALPLRLERRVLGPNRERLGLSVGEIVGMNLLRRTDGKQPVITHGAVRFGGPAGEPERAGLWVSGSVKALDLDRWLDVLAPEGGEVRIEWGGVDLRIGALDVFRRRFSDLAVQSTFAEGQWRGVLSGRELDGSVTYAPQKKGRLVARMRTLAIPDIAPGAVAPEASAGRARKDFDLPALDVVAEQFVNKGKPLGRLEVAAASEGRDWRIEKLRITNPESTFTLDGLWHPGVAPQRTQVNLRLEASDVGRLLARLGYPEGVRRGTARLEGALAWNGAPHDFDFPSLTGNLVLEAAKGQFLKIEPGIGKLLGILSLQALPRRIALDFRDVFSEGFSFDQIVGAIKINRGVASTENLRIQGPPARVVMKGEVDLARETQNLAVQVTPHLSDTVSIAGALIGGPIAGVAAYLAQKVLREPLDQAASYGYSITGTWADPVVKRLEREPAPDAAQSPGFQ